MKERQEPTIMPPKRKCHRTIYNEIPTTHGDIEIFQMNVLNIWSSTTTIMSYTCNRHSSSNRLHFRQMYLVLCLHNQDSTNIINNSYKNLDNHRIIEVPSKLYLSLALILPLSPFNLHFITLGENRTINGLRLLLLYFLVHSIIHSKRSRKTPYRRFRFHQSMLPELVTQLTTNLNQCNDFHNKNNSKIHIKHQRCRSIFYLKLSKQVESISFSRRWY